ncbi:MAG: phosphoribosylglycinamide formyltransferase [Bacteroidia bacterium]|nr:phosphoribosylglycinamide formyltransferase [Bacteroidia bacterium]
MKRLAIFASGSGTNAENISLHFSGNPNISVEVIITNNPEAGVIQRAKKLNIPFEVVTRKEFSDSTKVVKLLEDYKIDVIVLAGFLLLVPVALIEDYKDRIINIHPALLPLFGGKGFYGANVHQKVIETKSLISGITIHHVNEFFDDGEIIFQAACHIAKDDTPESLAEKIHDLEKMYFPVVIEKFVQQLL